MKPVFQTFLYLLLVVSLIATPVTTALAAASLDSELLHATVPKQNPVGVHEKMLASFSCVAGDDSCTCPNITGCQHVTASTSLLLPAGLLEATVEVHEHPVTGLRVSPDSLKLPPESPPPIA